MFLPPDKRLIRPFWLFAIVFLFTGIFAFSQDMIIMRNGEVIEAIVIEISLTEIKYKRFEHLDGPTIVIPRNHVLSIRYENGTVEIINDVTVNRQTNYRNRNTPMMDTDRVIFSIGADPTGFLFFGPAISMEFTKSRFYTQIYTNFPSLGLLSNMEKFCYGIGASFNYFWHSSIGGFYLGGLLGYKYGAFRNYGWYNPEDGDWYTERYNANYQWKERSVGSSFTLALNAGYKFVFSSGVYFRIGGNIGADFGKESNFLLIPDMLFGYNF